MQKRRIIESEEESAKEESATQEESLESPNQSVEEDL